MKYFTAEEATAVIDNNSITLCSGWDCNPALDQAKALHEYIKTDRACQNDPLWAAVCGFLLGRATGIREERQRRKGAQA